MGQSRLIFRSRKISAILFVIVDAASCEKKLQTCDTRLCNLKGFCSSLLRCKLQEKLLRVTWP